MQRTLLFANVVENVPTIQENKTYHLNAFGSQSGSIYFSTTMSMTNVHTVPFQVSTTMNVDAKANVVKYPMHDMTLQEVE